MRCPDLTLTVGLYLLLVFTGIEAHLYQSLSEPSNELEYYLARSLVSSPLQSNSADGEQRGGEEAYLVFARDFLPQPEVSADDNGIEYLPGNPIERSKQNGGAEFQRLVETIEELARQEDQGLLLNNELNKHLPSNNPYSIEGPINDPVEFEAAISQLTNALNHGIPNTSNRSAVLDDLLSSYLGSVVKELQQQKDSFDDTTSYNFTGLLNQKSNNNDDDEDNAVNDNEPTQNKQHAGSEYIDHPLALIGHQYMQGGAGEGRQLLGPDGSFENIQVIKSDRAVPSYCDPPNPCPIGYTAEDGCLEKFVNSASFSREYQVKQKCSCDNEHSLFNCGSPTAKTIKNYASGPSSSPSSKTLSDEENDDNNVEQQKGGDGDNKLDTLARAIQNRYGNLESIRKLINEQGQNS